MFDNIHKFIKQLKANKRASAGGIFGKLLGLFLGITLGVALIPDAIRTLANTTTWADTGSVITSLGSVALPVVVMGVFVLLLIRDAGVDI